MSAKANILIERTLFGIATIINLRKKYPKANINELIEIVMYVGMAVYHKIPAEEKFKHLM